MTRLRIFTSTLRVATAFRLPTAVSPPIAIARDDLAVLH
jgi:hypothetical protein